MYVYLYFMTRWRVIACPLFERLSQWFPNFLQPRHTQKLFLIMRHTYFSMSNINLIPIILYWCSNNSTKQFEPYPDLQFFFVHIHFLLTCTACKMTAIVTIFTVQSWPEVKNYSAPSNRQTNEKYVPDFACKFPFFLFFLSFFFFLFPFSFFFFFLCARGRSILYGSRTLSVLHR